MADDKMTISNDMKKMLENAVKVSGEVREVQYCETGVIGFDLAISNGKGLPIGTSILFWAEAGIGKSTLVGDISKRLIQKHEKKGEPYRVLYLAVESSRELFNKMGVGNNPNFLYVEQQFTWRQIEVFYEAVLRGLKGYENIKVIVIDSINNILSDQNVSKSVADGDFGTKAKERGSFYAKYLARCKEKGITSFFIAQARQNQDAGMFGDPKKAAATYADKHNVEVILKCGKKSNKSEAGKIKTKTIYGEVSEQVRYLLTLNSSATDCKNRFCSGLPSEILIEKGKGAVNNYTIKKMLDANGYVKEKNGGSNGKWYILDENIAQQIGLKDNQMHLSEFYNMIDEQVVPLVNFLKEHDQYKLDISVDTSNIDMDPADEDNYEEGGENE